MGVTPLRVDAPEWYLRGIVDVIQEVSKDEKWEQLKEEMKEENKVENKVDELNNNITRESYSN